MEINKVAFSEVSEDYLNSLKEQINSQMDIYLLNKKLHKENKMFIDKFDLDKMDMVKERNYLFALEQQTYSINMRSAIKEIEDLTIKYGDFEYGMRNF